MKLGNSKEAGLVQFATQTELVNSRLAGAWQCVGMLEWLPTVCAHQLNSLPTQRSML